MASVNVVVLLGHLCRDVEIRTVGTSAVGSFSIGVNRSWNDKVTHERREEVCFVDIECWGQTAEIAQKYLSKGSPVLVQGRLKLDQWEDKQTGQKRSRLKVVAERLQLVGQKPPAPPRQEDQDGPVGSGETL